MKLHIKLVLIGVLALVMGLFQSCSGSTNIDEPSMNPFVRANDTIRIEGQLYLNGVKIDIHGDFRIMLEATSLDCAFEPNTFSTTDTSRNYFELNLTGKEISVDDDWPQYRQILLNTIKARPYYRMPYDKDVAQLPVYHNYPKVCLDNIVKVDIITEQDFNADYPAGSSMNEACELSVTMNKPFIEWVKNYGPDDPDPNTVSMWSLRHLFYHRSNIQTLDYSRIEWPDPNILYFHINTLPKEAGEYTFLVTIRMSSGNILTRRHTVRYK